MFEAHGVCVGIKRKPIHVTSGSFTTVDKETYILHIYDLFYVAVCCYFLCCCMLLYFKTECKAAKSDIWMEKKYFGVGFFKLGPFRNLKHTFICLAL